MCISVYGVRFLNTEALPALEPDGHLKKAKSSIFDLCIKKITLILAKHYVM